MSRPSFTRRDRAAVVDGKREFFGPDPEPDDGEGDTPDAWPLDLWPQELAEQQEQQQ